MKSGRIIRNGCSSRDFTGLLEMIDDVSRLYDGEGISYNYDIYTNGKCWSAIFTLYD